MNLLENIGALARRSEVAAHVAADRLIRPAARRRADVPYSWEAVTKDWLTATLCTSVPGGKILDFVPTGGSVGTSTRQGFRLTRNSAAIAAGVPEHIFTKSTPILMQRLLLGLSHCVDGEVGFYRSFRNQVEMEAPLGYHACLAPRSLRSMVVMEDVVATKGARFNMQGDAISKEQMADLLGSLARLHAGFWNSADLTTRNWLRDTVTYLHGNHQFLQMAHWGGIGMEVAPHLIPKRLQGRINDIWDGIVRWNTAARAFMPSTLLHGDAHIAQTYMTQEGRMGFSDWQVLLKGSWAWDVSYIVSTGLEIEDRRSWERDLLASYLAELEAAGGPAIDWNEAWDCYRANIPYAFMAWAFTIGHNSATQSVQPALTTERLFQRTAIAMDDLDSIRATEI